MVVMKIKLYKDSAGALHAEFLDGLNSVSQNNSNVNGVLVVLDNFDLVPEEVLRIAYELESGAEVDDYTLMEDNGDGTYSAEVPPAVTRSDVGTEWFLGLQIASNWVENDDYTGYLYKQNLVERLKFKVNNAVKDLNGKYPSRGDLTALYQEAQAKIEKEEKNAETIESLQDEMPLVAKSILNSSDFFSPDGEEMYVSIGKFNRTPIIGEDFVVIVQGSDESSYIVHYRVLELDGVHAVCKLIDSHKLDASKVTKTGDTMTGDLSFSQVNGNSAKVGRDGFSVSSFGGVVYTLLSSSGLDIKNPNVETPTRYRAEGIVHQGREIKLPEVRYHIPNAENSSYYAYDETLAVLSDIEPIADKLDEVEGVAKGGQQGISFVSYADMVSELAGEQTELTHPKNQSIYIETVDVPDLWISKIEDVYVAYEYTNDDAIVSALATNGYIQVGYYRLAQLETGKVNLPEYVKFTDIATQEKAGISRIFPSSTKSKDVGVGISGNEIVNLIPATNAQIESKEYQRAITTQTIDYAWKVSATTNTETWTDEDKAKACETIGAYKRINGSSGNAYVPATIGGDNTETHYRVSAEYVNGLGAQTIPLRDDEGGLRVQENPTNPLHAVPRKWVESLIAELASVEGNVTIVQGTKLYKHTLDRLSYADNASDLSIISSRSTPYTYIYEIIQDFANPHTRITVKYNDGADCRLQCTQVHTYGGFYFHDDTKVICVSTGGITACTDSVTEYTE